MAPHKEKEKTENNRVENRAETKKKEGLKLPFSGDIDSHLDSKNIKQLFSSFLKIMKEQEGLRFEDLSAMYFEGEQNIPAEVFAGKLSPSEAVCKYMKENLSKKFNEIAEALKRDDRSIWTSYSRAIKKQKNSIKISNPVPFIPITILQNRKLSFLESIVFYLHNQKLRPKQIAIVLHRKAPIIHTVLNRVRKKLKIEKGAIA